MKGLLLRVLPEFVLSRLKRIHYVRALASFSEVEVAVIKELVVKGDRALDVGANVGWYTRILSELVGESGRVYSIEPIPETFALLSYCVKKLHLSNVETFNYAVSDKDGIVRMEIPKYGGGGDNYYQSRIVEGGSGEGALRSHAVESRSIDSLFPAAETRISFIKCDVEGHELAVARGAENVTRRSFPAWLVEVSSNPDEDGTEARLLFSHYEQMGYGAYWYADETLHLRRKGEQPTNCFFLRENHVARLKASGMGFAA